MLGAGLSLVSVLAWPGRARAADALPLELMWEAPESCPKSDAVLARVVQIAGNTAKRASLLQAEAVVTETPEHQFALRLKIRSGRLVGTREIKGRSCTDLVGALAVALALLLSPEEPLDEADLGEPPPPDTSRAAPDESRPALPEAPPPATEPPPPSDGSARHEPARRWRGLLTLPLAALGIGPQRHVSQGIGLAAGLSIDDWRIHAEGKLWASRNAMPWSQEEYGATLKQLTVTLRGCRRVWGTRFELSPCLLVSVQHLSARGVGPRIAPETSDATWFAPGLGLRARVLVTPWLGVVAGADGDVQLSQPEVTLEGVGSVERLYPVAATVTLGVEWIL